MQGHHLGNWTVGIGCSRRCSWHMYLYARMSTGQTRYCRARQAGGLAVAADLKISRGQVTMQRTPRGAVCPSSSGPLETRYEDALRKDSYGVGGTASSLAQLRQWGRYSLPRIPSSGSMPLTCPNIRGTYRRRPAVNYAETVYFGTYRNSTGFTPIMRRSC